MTSHRRVSILAVAALLIAGCGPTPATTPEASPTVPLNGTPGPSPTQGAATSSPTPATTAVAVNPDCPTTIPDGEPGVSLDSESGTFHPDLRITSIAPLSNPAAVEHPDRDSLVDTVALIGGRDTSFALSYYQSSWPEGYVFTDARARLTLDGRAPLEVPVQLEPQAAATATNMAMFRLPDVAGTGTIELDLSWNDACFALTGVLASPVRISTSASVAACSTDVDGAFAELEAAFEPPIRVATLDVDLFAPYPRGKITPMPMIDPPPPYLTFKRETPTLTQEPGALVRVTYSNPAVELVLKDGAAFAFYRRGPLLRWIEGGWIHGDEPEAPIVFRSRPFLRNDGAFAFYVPTQPARYAAELIFDYDSACSYGTAGGAVGIDIVVPSAESSPPEATPSPS